MARAGAGPETDRLTAIGTAVVDLIDEFGLGYVSIRHVADRVGLSIGAIQYWFPTKSALLLHAHAHVSSAISAHAEQAVASMDDPKDVLRATLHAMLPTSPNVSRLLKVFVCFETQALHDEELADRAHADTAGLHAAMSELFGLAGVDRPRHEAVAAVALVGGLAGQLLAADPWFSLDDAIDVIDAHLDRVCGK